MIRVISFILLLHCCTMCTTEERRPFRIAASANVQYAMGEIAEKFFKKTGVEYELITSSSGKLTVQISNGAPYDIFLSADARYPSTLEQKGLTEGMPITYAYGQLVLWSASDTPFDSFEVLESEYIHYIALANPATAPYGRATEEVLNNLGYWEKIQGKFVFGESITQTNQFIETGTANIGFTALSVVMSPQNPENGHWLLVPDTLHNPIEQQLVITSKDSSNLAVARDFVSFLQSDEALNILHKYGYKTP